MVLLFLERLDILQVMARPVEHQMVVRNKKWALNLGCGVLHRRVFRLEHLFHITARPVKCHTVVCSKI